MRYLLTHPMIITSRLMPGIGVGDTHVLSVKAVATDGHRTTFAWWLDELGKGNLAKGEDIHVSAIGDDEPGDLARKAVHALLSFLSNDAEGYRHYMGAGEPVDGYAFDPDVAEWAYGMSEEIEAAQLDLDYPDGDPDGE
jgi:hypothetical protein